MNTQIQLPNPNPTASTILHTVCLNQGRLAVRSRHDFPPALLARAEKLAAAGGGAFISELGLCQLQLLMDSSAAILLLEREDGKLGSGGLADRKSTRLNSSHANIS